MTSLKKTCVTVAAVAVVGVNLYQSQQAAQTRGEVRMIQQQVVVMDERLDQLQKGLDDALMQMTALAEESATGRSNASDFSKLRDENPPWRAAREAATEEPLTAEANSWLTRVSQVKEYLERTPEKRIPELQFLTPGDWLSAVRDPGVGDEVSLRKTLQQLRNIAKARVAPQISDALKRFMDANESRFPTEVTQLAPYFEPPLDGSILARYAVVPASEIASSDRYLKTDCLIAEKAAVDVDFDTRFVVGLNGRWNSDFDGDILMPVVQACQAANKGVATSGGDLSVLLPYAQTPEQQQALQRWIQRERVRNRDARK